MSNQGKFILCVDDDSDDLLFLQEAIHSVEPDIKIVQFQNGAETLKYLADAKADHHLPCVVVLDINMPVMNGKETLRRIKADHGLDHVQVVMLTTSSTESDKSYFRDLGVKMFTKPMTHKEMKEIAQVFVQHCREA